jgi:beta-lactamase class C
MLGHHPTVIPKSVLNEIFKRHIPINEDSKYYETWAPGLSDAYYGLGWRIFNYKKHKIIYHGGFVRGYRPEMGFCPKEDIGIVFLTNASKNKLSTTCVHAFFEMYFAPRVPS